MLSYIFAMPLRQKPEDFRYQEKGRRQPQKRQSLFILGLCGGGQLCGGPFAPGKSLLSMQVRQNQVRLKAAASV
jgi:hypothetical protein